MRRLWLPTFELQKGRRVCKIPLTRGLFAVIDAKYLSAVQLYSWYAIPSRNVTYASTVYPFRGRQKSLPLHQLIWRLAGRKPTKLDHRNGDGLDCRLRNLRPGPARLNGANRRKSVSRCTSTYKGVYWNKQMHKWKVHIRIDGQIRHLGYFTRECAVQAALAYDKAAFAAWGDYAKLNFP